jgi:glutathione peroxidase-family protein
MSLNSKDRRFEGAQMSVYDFSARTIDGNDFALSSYRGHALLVSFPMFAKINVNGQGCAPPCTNRRDSAVMSRRC